MQAIQTNYNGVLFRSRLEARWAILFDQLGLHWRYEYEGYQTSKGYYVPDFWLPDVYVRDDLGSGTLFEVKPDNYPDCIHEQLEEVASTGNFNAMLACGFYPDTGESMEKLFQIAKYWDNPMLILPCPKCKTVKFEFPNSNYMDCPKCKYDIGHSDVEYTVASYVRYALNYRFW